MALLPVLPSVSVSLSLPAAPLVSASGLCVAYRPTAEGPWVLVAPGFRGGNVMVLGAVESDLASRQLIAVVDGVPVLVPVDLPGGAVCHESGFWLLRASDLFSGPVAVGSEVLASVAASPVRPSSEVRAVVYGDDSFVGYRSPGGDGLAAKPLAWFAGCLWCSVEDLGDLVVPISASNLSLSCGLSWVPGFLFNKGAF